MFCPIVVNKHQTDFSLLKKPSLQTDCSLNKSVHYLPLVHFHLEKKLFLWINLKLRCTQNAAFCLERSIKLGQSLHTIRRHQITVTGFQNVELLWDLRSPKKGYLKLKGPLECLLLFNSNIKKEDMLLTLHFAVHTVNVIQVNNK